MKLTKNRIEGFRPKTLTEVSRDRHLRGYFTPTEEEMAELVDLALQALSSLSPAPSSELTVAHVEAAFRNGVKMAICELVLDDKMAETFGGMKDGGATLMKQTEAGAFKEWQKQGGPCKPYAIPTPPGPRGE